jgi:hypothetical protein
MDERVAEVERLMAADVPVGKACKRAGIARSTYYWFQDRRKKIALESDNSQGLTNTPETAGRDPEKDTRVSPDETKGDI